MSRTYYAHIGSGTTPFITNLRKGVWYGHGNQGEGYREGVNTIISNFEDNYSSPVMAVSGMTLSASEVREITSIFNVYGSGHINHRYVDIYHIGPAPYLLVANTENIVDEYAWPITAGNSKKFAVMNNVQIFVKASGAETDLRWHEC